MQLTSTQQAGATQLVEFNLVSTLLECLQSEPEVAIQNTILMTLYNTMKVNTDVLLNGGAMKVFVQFLDASTDVAIRKNVARNIMALSIPLDGKVQACENDAIPPLVFLLRNTRPPTALGNDDDWSVSCPSPSPLRVHVGGCVRARDWVIYTASMCSERHRQGEGVPSQVYS